MDKLNNIKHIRDWMPETDEMFSKRGLAPEMPIKSIPRLDGFLWGLHRQEMLVVAARPSNFKSVMAIQIAWDMAKAGKSVYFMSLEMAVPRIIERIFTNQCLVDNGVIWRGALKTDKIISGKYEEFKSKLGKTKLVLSDMIGRTAQDLKAIEDAFERHPDVIVIDHLNEISGGDNKSLAIEQYLGRIREMAIRRNVALVVCSQVNRSSRSDDDKKPQLHQIKGCVHPDTIVGGKTIRDRVENNDYSFVPSVHTNSGIKCDVIPSNLIHSGIKKCLKIKTKSGKEIILSTDTMLYDGKEWRKSSTFKLKDKITIDNRGEL
jgi:replicative DNA helicase